VMNIREKLHHRDTENNKKAQRSQIGHYEASGGSGWIAG